MALFKLAFKYYTLSHDKRPYYCKVFSRNLERMQNHFLCNRSRFINIIHGNVQSGNNFRSVGINSHIEIDTIECNYLRK